MGFIDAVLTGMGDDGGLLIPESIPHVSGEMLQSWQTLGYQSLALEILGLYVDDEIPRSDLSRLVEDSYRLFRDPAVTPLRHLDSNRWVLELFHGPTFAFKDVALQWLGNLYEYVAQSRRVEINILGATSGDTGASAVAGVRGKPGIRICILYPYQKVSKVQELQMSTVDDETVLTLAVSGSFDDCQAMIKDVFGDVRFKQKYHLRAINSINIARILAQIVYYFYAYLQLQKAGHRGAVSFSVPTGNFGNVFAGYLARRMGLPVDRLLLATNANNILERFVHTGVYQPTGVHTTYSPSMDIQIASNFERYLYYLSDENGETVNALMTGFKRSARISLERATLSQVQLDFSAYSVSNQACLETISHGHQAYGYVMDPHTACAAAAADHVADPDEPVVILSTAHPAKFNEAMEILGISQAYPPEIAELFSKPQVTTVVDADPAVVRDRLVSFLLP